MSASVVQYLTFRFSGFNPYKKHTRLQSMSFVGSSQRDLRVFAVASTANEAWNYIPSAPIYLPEGPWKQVVTLWIPGGVTAANGFKAAGMYGGLHAKGEKLDLAVVTCDVDAISADWLPFRQSCLDLGFEWAFILGFPAIIFVTNFNFH
ncbi:hypothetical protein Vadar_010602 [Vaccinium darrowii]|uniref:Uncharacterized protein n=1 Tax=Vaccinium darrowii TaxID=229202 RepID=A0ACB7XPP2_9ERIC|nr:hypothetical protein Vadar_010602 [Vaccinium darrowii]